MSLPRAVARGVGYPILILLAVALFPLTVGVAVATNYRGTAERLNGIPGVGADGGVLSGVLVFSFVVALLAGIGGLASEANPVRDRQPPAADDGAAVDAPPTATPTVTAAPTSTPEATTALDVRPASEVRRFCLQFEKGLEEESKIRVSNRTATDDNCYITYKQADRLSEEAVSENISVIIGAYGAAVDTLPVAAPARTNFTVLDDSGDTRARYYINTTWVKQWNDGEITTSELSNRTFATVTVES